VSPLNVLEIVAPPFLVIFLGYLYNLIKKTNTDLLVQFAMKVLVPAFAFYHFLRMEIDPSLLGQVFMSAWIIMLGSGLVGFFIFRMLSIKVRGLYLPIMFMNTINLPFPILLSAYGDRAIFFSLSFYLASLIGIFTIGILLVTGKNESHRVFREPIIYALIAAFYFKYTGTLPPELVTKTCGLLQNATIPIILLALGMQLSMTTLSHLKTSIIASVCRMGGGLIIGIACVKGFHLEGLAGKVVLFNAMMPSAMISYIVAHKFSSEGPLVASTILVSTLISLATIPLALILLG